MRAIRSAALVACVFMGCAPKSPAQSIRKSQLASVMQMIGETRIEIIYRRPVARGRELYGALVPWGRIWSPSADTAAIFRTTTDLDVGSARLPAGRYSIWAIPDRESWTIIFSSVVPVFHIRYPEGRDVLRVKATPRPGDHMETLAFYFPMVDGDSAVLNLHWGKTIVALPIRARQRTQSTALPQRTQRTQRTAFHRGEREERGVRRDRSTLRTARPFFFGVN